MEKVWFNGKRFYPALRKNLFFSFFFLSQQLQPLFGSCETPPLHFLGDLTQALLRELACTKLLHTSRTCST